MTVDQIDETLEMLTYFCEIAILNNVLKINEVIDFSTSGFHYIKLSSSEDRLPIINVAIAMKLIEVI